MYYQKGCRMINRNNKSQTEHHFMIKLAVQLTKIISLYLPFRSHDFVLLSCFLYLPFYLVKRVASFWRKRMSWCYLYLSFFLSPLFLFSVQWNKPESSLHQPNFLQLLKEHKCIYNPSSIVHWRYSSMTTHEFPVSHFF